MITLSSVSKKLRAVHSSHPVASFREGILHPVTQDRRGALRHLTAPYCTGTAAGLHWGQTPFSSTISVPLSLLLYFLVRVWVTTLCIGVPLGTTLPQLSHL